MKKAISFIIATVFIHLSLFAQDTSQLSKRNKTFAKKTITQQSYGDEPAVHLLVATLVNGWNTKSGKMFSSAFADVHDYIVVDGMYFSNFTKKGNEVAHQGLFDGVFKNRIIKLTVEKVTFFRKDLAQIIAIGANYEKGSNPPEDPGVIMTVIAEKNNNLWKIISFHNHGFNAEEIKQRGVPLNIIYASWYKK